MLYQMKSPHSGVRAFAVYKKSELQRGDFLLPGKVSPLQGARGTASLKDFTLLWVWGGL